MEGTERVGRGRGWGVDGLAECRWAGGDWWAERVSVPAHNEGEDKGKSA